MKICIVGTGAMGSIYAGLLSAAGNEIRAVDRWADHIEAIRKITAYELVNADSKVWEEKLTEKHWPLTTPPYIDGKYIPEHPLDLIRKGAAAEVDLLIGTNLNESSSMKPDKNNNFGYEY